MATVIRHVSEDRIYSVRANGGYGGASGKAPDIMEQELWSVKTIERATLVIATVFVVVGSFFWPTAPVIGGLLSGAIVSYLNFRFLRRMVQKFLEGEDVAHHRKSGLRFFIKMILLIAIVGGLLLYVQVNPVAFLVGFSSFVLAIGYEGLRSWF